MSREILIQQLNMGMQFLSYQEKIVLQLVYYEDLTDDEVCEVMDISLDKMGMLLCSARLKMRSFTSIFDDIDNAGKTGIRIVNS